MDKNQNLLFAVVNTDSLPLFLIQSKRHKVNVDTFPSLSQYVCITCITLVCLSIIVFSLTKFSRKSCSDWMKRKRGKPIWGNL